ncbi:MAG: helix-turn-helix domain-containing protein [Halobacteriovoraceae bacterium]|nr:helix-turn-helix domain-containing protein [Halobacteriovoraceae bacterium]MCB9093447.1 helix-turn-helix domain-containing protein [Halobacteriovoraceae bacterium]
MANEVKNLREKLGISQSDLADALGVSGQVVVSRWERSERTIGEPLRRFFAWLNTLPKGEAKEIIEALRGQKDE